MPTFDVTNYDPEAERAARRAQMPVDERTAARRTVDLNCSEGAFQDAVVDLARLTGWKVAHFRPGRTASGWRTPVSADGKGFFDLVMVHSERELLLMVEVKAERGKASPEQLDWAFSLAPIATVCEEYMAVTLWRPSDWPEIERILTGEEPT